MDESPYARIGTDALRAWAERVFGLWARGEPASNCHGGPLAPYLELFACDLPGFAPLVCGADLIGEPRSATFPARELSIGTLMPGPNQPPRAELLQGFENALKTLPSHHTFEAFGYQFQRFAWAVPSTLGDPRCSLYEQYKALCAMVYASEHATRPATEFVLIGGDLPGIQPFLYTLTSKGAAKMLRGRSFFLQLLGDAIVRRLVDDLGLCWANVVYQAGGNFCLLAPASDTTQNTVQDLATDLNANLLEHLGGDVYLALASQEITTADLLSDRFVKARNQLGRQIAAQKRQPFARLLATGTKDVFGPHGSGGSRACAVCHNEATAQDALDRMLDPTGQRVDVCHMCQSFGGLAQSIGKSDLWLEISRYQAFLSVDTWQRLLGEISEYLYRFSESPPTVSAQRRVYAVNDTSMADATGYLFLANTTPRLKDAEAVALNQAATDHPDQNQMGVEQTHRVGHVKDFGLMAEQARGISRIGVLRMDVDDMGKLFAEELQGNMCHLSRLSTAMNQFFCGHLNTICEQIETGRDRTLYVIYAGGDDLFIVGAWDRIPELAARIRADFEAYTNKNPLYSLSGGMTLEREHFPLYRAAETSGEAEASAKSLQRPGHHKAAFSLLGRPIGWEQWQDLVACHDTLETLLAHNAPHSLLRTLQTLDAMRREAQDEATNPLQIWGRWNWMAAYSLTRLASSLRRTDKDLIRAIQSDWIANNDRMALWGLAARWVELLQRGES